MKKFEITKEPSILQWKTPHYHFQNHIKHDIKRKKFTKHEILNMIHINQALETNMQLNMSNMKSDQ